MREVQLELTCMTVWIGGKRVKFSWWEKRVKLSWWEKRVGDMGWWHWV